MNSSDVSFASGGCQLAGTFADAASPVAAALLLPGGGKTDRDSDVQLPLGQQLRIGITRSVAGSLAQARVPSLRFDKRGVGASGGDYYAAGMDERRADAAAALDRLAARHPGLPLLAVGHSEGCYYAAQLGADDDRVAGVVLLSGAARPGGEELAWQTRQLAARLPRSARLILRLLRTDAIRAQRKNQEKVMAATQDAIWVQGRKVAARWFRDFVRYDPAVALARLRVPVLAITGGHDLQVPPADVEAMGKLIPGPFEGHVLGDLSHLLRPDPDSLGPRGYRLATRDPVSPEVLTLITDWVARHWDGTAR
jgi:uncharacterized protein